MFVIHLVQGQNVCREKMKINPIIAINNNIQPKFLNQPKNSLRVTNPENITQLSGAYYSPVMQNSPKTIVFHGRIVHIIDGGIHADNMKHFMHAMKSSAEITMHDVEVNSKDIYTKQLKSVEEQLKKLNERSDDYSSEFIALPVLAQVPLLNIQDQYKEVIGEDITLTPQNIKSNKAKLMTFLRKIYERPEWYREYTGYMDPILQGIEYSYGIIQEINKLVAKKAKVYLPSGHPNDLTVKWMAGEKNLKPEIYHYIATGEDLNGSVAAMEKEIKDKNWYSFNLLTLSNARIVGLKSPDWKSDYIFSAYDSCINDSARGVFNLTPLREGDKVVGFTYLGSTNDYPYEEFPLLSRVEDLLPFVGKKKSEVLATEDETEEFVKTDKLYKIEDVFTPQEIEEKKISLRGKFVDKSLKLFFDENNDGDIIFRNCDCERSGRPSVMPVWGSCYAALNAIARDINVEEQCINSLDGYRRLLNSGISAMNSYDFDAAENLFEQANTIAKSILTRTTEFLDLYKSAEKLGDMYYRKGDLDAASGCYNFAIDTLANHFKNYSKSKGLDNLGVNYDKYKNYKGISEFYDSQLRDYESLSAWEKIFSTKPQRPVEYGKHKLFTDADNEYKTYVLKFVSLYENIADICRKKGESYAAEVCEAAVKDIRSCSGRGSLVINKRADKIQFIGDLYREIKPHQ